MNPFDPGYFNEHDLKNFGFKALGQNVQISKNCTIIGLENIEISDNVRIDGYCSIIAGGQGWLKIGSFVHVGAYCRLAAGSGIYLNDFSGLSHGVRIYSRIDSFSGESLTNPTVPEKYTSVISGTVTLNRHVAIGSGSVILPRVTIGEGSAVGALSLVVGNLEPWGIFLGSPAKRLKDRSKHLLKLETQLRQELAQQDSFNNELPPVKEL